MTQTYVGTLVIMECYKCHCAFGLTQDHYRRAKETGINFYCPNGHDQVFTTSEIDKLKRELLSKETTIQWLREDSNWQKEQRKKEYRRRVAMKGTLTKIKNKICAGKCPKCDKVFDDLKAHMQMHKKSTRQR